MRYQPIKTPFLSVFFFLAITILSPSCKPSSGQAEDYYDRALNTQQAVLEKEDILIKLINLGINNAVDDTVNNDIIRNNGTMSQISVIDKAYADFCLQIDLSLEEANNLNAFDGKTTIKDATIRLLKEYKKLSGKEYKEVCEIVKNASVSYTDEAENRLFELTGHIDTCLQADVDNYTRVCKDFAAEYKFEIEDPKNDKQ